MPSGAGSLARKYFEFLINMCAPLNGVSSIIPTSNYFQGSRIAPGQNAGHLLLPSQKSNLTCLKVNSDRDKQYLTRNESKISSQSIEKVNKGPA